MATPIRHPWDYNPLLWPNTASSGPNGEASPVSVAQAAKSLGYSQAYVYSLIRSKRIYACWIRRRWWVYLHTYRPPLD